MPKAHPVFGNKRLNTPAARRRLDIGIVITGLIIAFVLAVLTWINYQNHNQSAAPSAADKSVTITGQSR